MHRGGPEERPVNVLIHMPKQRPFFAEAPEAETVVAEINRRPGARGIAAASQEAMEKLLPEAQVYMGVTLTADQVRMARNLRWIQAPMAGVDNYPLRALASQGIQLTSSRGAMAVAMAEHALAMMLAWARDLDIVARQQPVRVWRRPQPLRPLRELAGATLGILGYGAIGRELGVRAAALGMRVLGVRRAASSGGEHHPQPAAPASGEGSIEVYGPERADEVIALSDYLVLLLPLTEATRGYLNAERLQRMKPGSVLINVARGAVVDERALVAALRSGPLAGALLDVFEQEPLPVGSELWGMPNALITPHLGGQTPHYWRRVLDLFYRNLDAYLAGEPLVNVVNLEHGY